MAKANGKKRQTKVSVTETQFKLTDAGIPGYVRRQKVGEHQYEITQADRAAELELLNDQTSRLEQKLAQAEHLAQAAIRPHVQPWNGKADDILAGYQGTALDLGNGKCACLIPVEQSEELREAIDALRKISGLRAKIERDPEAAYWLAQAYVLGMLHERMIVWPSTTDALRTKQQRETMKKAGNTKANQQRAQREWACREYGLVIKTIKDGPNARTEVLKRLEAETERQKQVGKGAFKDIALPKIGTITTWVREALKRNPEAFNSQSQYRH
jgi:hypothetical protein